MPYFVREVSPHKFKVFSIHGTPLSKRPMSLKKANRQLAAVYSQFFQRQKELIGSSKISDALKNAANTKDTLKNIFNESINLLKKHSPKVAEAVLNPRHQ